MDALLSALGLGERVQSFAPPQLQTVRGASQGDIELMSEKRVLSGTPRISYHLNIPLAFEMFPPFRLDCSRR